MHHVLDDAVAAPARSVRVQPRRLLAPEVVHQRGGAQHGPLLQRRLAQHLDRRFSRRHAQTRFSRHTPVLQGRRVRRRGPFSLLSHVGRRAACGAWGGATCPFDALFRAAQQRLSRTPARQFCRGAADVVVSHTICCSGHHEMTHSRACRCLHNQARTATVAASEAWRWAHRRGQRECLITWMASQEHGCTQNSKKTHSLDSKQLILWAYAKHARDVLATTTALPRPAPALTRGTRQGASASDPHRRSSRSMSSSVLRCVPSYSVVVANAPCRWRDSTMCVCGCV